MMKLLHAADFHLDSPLSGLPGAKSARRRRELREFPGRLAALAQAEKVDLALLPGDLFDGERVYPETLQALAQALEDIAVPVFIAPGNHDYYHSRSPYAAQQWPDNVHIFTRPTLEAVELPGLNCVVHGCAFTAPRREDDPLADFATPDDGRTHLLCVHGEMGRLGNYAPIAPGSLERSGAAYAALGHVHAAGSGTAGKTLWAYPGCPEGRGFDELGPKGVYIVTVDANQAGIRFVETGRRQYRVETVNVGELAAALPQGESPDLVRLLIAGESRNPLDLPALTAQAAPHFFHVELRDITTLPANLWARAGEDSLTGLFLREMRAQLDGAEAGEREKLLLCARFGLAALEGGEDIRP